MDKFIDRIPDSLEDAVEIIQKYFSTSRKIISVNYSRNNFSVLRRKYPLLWSFLKNREIKFKNSVFSFRINEKLGEKLTINRKTFVFSKQNLIYKNVYRIYRMFQGVFQENLKQKIKENIKIFSEGFRILKFIEKFYPQSFRETDKFLQSGQRENQTVFRWLNGIKQRPKINGIPLKFRTYASGYEVYDLYLKLKDVSGEKNILCVFQEEFGKTSVKVSRQLEYFFPDLFRKINEWSDARYFSTRFWLYLNRTKKFPECECCGNPVKESIDYRWNRFCSRRCKNIFQRIQTTENSRKIFGDKWEILWSSYKKLVMKYSQVSYLLFKDIINPENLKRGKKFFHMDHVISKKYGFLHKVPPEFIGHFKNLQMLPESENQSKRDKLLISENQVNLKISQIQKDLKNFNYYDKRRNRKENRRTEEKER